MSAENRHAPGAGHPGMQGPGMQGPGVQGMGMQGMAMDPGPAAEPAAPYAGYAAPWPGYGTAPGYAPYAPYAPPYGAYYPAAPSSAAPASSAGSRFLKGALVGAAAAYLLTNESVQRTVIRGAVQAWSSLQGGMEELKERFQDAEAELHAAEAAKSKDG